MNDIDNPEVATVCADRASAKSSFTFTPAVPSISPDAKVTVTRDLTEHRWGDGIYRTKLTLFFHTSKTFVDPTYGETRRESVSSINIHLDSSVSQPGAFTVGQPQTVTIGWGDGDPTFLCDRSGYSSYWVGAEALPYESGVVTLTRRDGAGLAGTIDIGGKQTLSFDAPYGESYPGEEGICCLK